MNRAEGIDLRSDTVTLPTPEMRRAMYEAELGDDVYGEDASVNRLQDVVAGMFKKEAALFVPSGTMGNLIGLLVNAGPTNEMIIDSQSHIFFYEGGGAATLGGIQLRTVDTHRGVLTPEVIRSALRPTGDVHQPTTAAISIENTHNRHGGSVWSLADLAAAAEAARENNLSVHMDGARIFNAATALGAPVDEIAAFADTISVCLSKGLGCPVGSLLIGPRDKITAGHRWRKMLGGGMRQAGVLAAAGLFALDNMVGRLQEDHATARRLAEGLRQVAGLEFQEGSPETNIVIGTVPTGRAREFVAECRSRGLLAGASSARTVRFVTHFGITELDVDKAVDIAQEAAGVTLDATAASIS